MRRKPSLTQQKKDRSVDAPVKTRRKYRQPAAPRLKGNKSGDGNRIDWKAFARKKKYKSVKAMFDALYGDSEEELQSGKLSLFKLSVHLGITQATLRREILKQGFKISPAAPKHLGALYPRTTIAYPYRKLGFKTEYAMWASFIEKDLKAKAILKILAEKTGRYYTYGTVNTHLNYARRYHKKRMALANKKLDTV